METTPQDVVPEVQATPAEKLEKFFDDVLERAKPTVKKFGIAIEDARAILQRSADRLYARKLPRWFARRSFDEAVIDLTDLGWGSIVIGDTPPNVAARYAQLLAESRKDPRNVRLRAVGLQGYVKQVEIGDTSHSFYRYAQPCPSVQHSEEKWIAWIGGMTGRVIERIEAGVNLFLEEDADAGK